MSINWLPGPAWVQEVVLDGQNYQLRAIWNDGFGYWTLDVLDGAGSVIVAGLRLVPNWELIRRYGDPALPPGYLTAYTITGQPEVIGYEDFINGVALLVYEPA